MIRKRKKKNPEMLDVEVRDSRAGKEGARPWHAPFHYSSTRLAPPVLANRGIRRASPQHCSALGHAGPNKIHTVSGAGSADGFKCRT